MGEATYYLKADFPAGVDVEKIAEELRKLLPELANFFDAWQSIRNDESRTPAERVADLKERFPQVWKEFGFDDLVVKDDDRPLNLFAGELDITPEFNLSTCGNQ